MAKSTTKKPAEKPEKPWADFPLFPHAAGYWAKKIRGRMCYFGSWSDDPEGTAALQQFKDQEQDLRAGRPVESPTSQPAGRKLHEVLSKFMDAKERAVKAGELHPRTFGEYHLTCKRLIEAFGRNRQVLTITIEQWAEYRAKLAAHLGHVTRANEIQRVRTVFKFAKAMNLIPVPVEFGPEFVKPSAKTMRKADNEKPTRTFSAVELRKLLKIAPIQLRAMIMLGVNVGFGNTDCALLPVEAVDLQRGIIAFPRPKTGIARRATLWPETVEALKKSRQFEDDREARRAERANKNINPDTPSSMVEMRGPAGPPLFFTTKYGKPWAQHGENKRDSAVGKEFAKLLKDCGIKRPGVSFYALRHTFATIASETNDIPAVYRIMGHKDHSIGDVYRHWHKDARENARLKAVTDHVRAWLFPRAVKK